MNVYWPTNNFIANPRKKQKGVFDILLPEIYEWERENAYAYAHIVRVIVISPYGRYYLSPATVKSI